MAMQTQPTSDTTAKKQITALNTLLRGELSAVETYDQALKQLAKERIIELTENRDCHAKRVPVLRERVSALGGTPDTSSELWGAWAKLVESGSAMMGTTSVIKALEEGEDRGLADYRRLQADLDGAARTTIETELLPAQKRTHERMSLLKNRA